MHVLAGRERGLTGHGIARVVWPSDIRCAPWEGAGAPALRWSFAGMATGIPRRHLDVDDWPRDQAPRGVGRERTGFVSARIARFRETR